MKEIKFEDLPKDYQRLLRAAEEAMETAYNPYSHFFVGAALLTLDNQIITGSNVENSSYGLSICAERSAILRANAMGKRSFKALAVITRSPHFDAKEPSGPCGACRQMLFESSQVAERDIEIILSTAKKDKIVITTISELLPMAFGPKDLGIDVKKYQ